jgi:hypothetical protein
MSLSDEEIEGMILDLIDRQVQYSIWTEDDGKAAREWLNRLKIASLAMNQLLPDWHRQMSDNADSAKEDP